MVNPYPSNEMASAMPESGNEVRIGVLFNPLSGKNRQSPGSVSQTVGQYPQAVQQNVQTPLEVHDAMTEFARRKINLVVISGGDGTVQAALTVLFSNQPFATLPQLIVLEAGTTNMIAGDVGISGAQNTVLRRLFHWAQTGSGRVTKVQRPVIRLQVPGHDVKCGMFFGAAAISQGVQYYQKNLHNKGLQGFPGICATLCRYLWAAVRRHNRHPAATGITVSLDGQTPQKEDFLLLFVTTLDRLFFGLHPFWGNEKGPLRYTAVRAEAKYLLRVLPMLARGRRSSRGTRENGYHSHNVKEVRLFLDSPVALDGEIYTPDSMQEPTVLQCGGRATFLRL
jgi:diacylglycerol kinase family enzyme